MFEHLARWLGTDLTLEKIFARLQQNAEVMGIILLGSGGRDALTVSSDFDVCVIIDNPRVPLWLTLTEVEGRVSEFYFVKYDFILEHLARQKLEIKVNSLENTYLKWGKEGKIVFDRTGKLTELRQKTLASYDLVWDSPLDLYAKLFDINYNLRETRRLLKSDDPVVGLTLDMRILLYGLRDLWYSYFQFRQIPWRGDKEAIKYLTQHDPLFLELITKLTTETNRAAKMELYTQVGAIATAPLGGLWAENSTIVTVEVPDAQKDGWQPAEIERALDFWSELLGIQ
jgi:predicted nucleotidyltransferase